MNQIQLIALRICDLRDIAGLTQEQVAERSGMTLEEYAAYESGTKDFSFSHLFNIAETLGVDISDLLTGEPSAFPSAGSSGGWASARPCFGN